MALKIDIQTITQNKNLPAVDFMQNIATAALADTEDAEITIRLVDTEESQTLNKTWRNIDKPTNVLSFPINSATDIVPVLMGDLVICAAIIENQAQQQNKTLHAHWAHMIIHGILHLMGYDHVDDAEAKTMETCETAIMNKCGYCDPYANDE